MWMIKTRNKITRNGTNGIRKGKRKIIQFYTVGLTHHIPVKKIILKIH